MRNYSEDPSPQNLRGVVDALAPTIQKAVKSFAPIHTPVVAHRARLLAADAVRSFSPTGGADLKTHVFRQLQRLQHEGPKITDPMPMPERMRRDNKAIMDALHNAGASLGSEVSDERLSELSGIPVKRILKIRKKMRKGISMSAFEAQGDDDDESPDIAQTSTDPYDEWVDATYHDLSDIDRVILSHRTGYRGAPVLSNSEIARRLKLSPGAVSQRANQIQSKLDQFNG